jgi:hypothetical protein
MNDAIQEHLAAANYAAAELRSLGKSAPISAHHELLARGLISLEKVVDALEKRNADEQAAQYAPAPSFDGDRARIAALEAELAALKVRHDGDITGLAKTLQRGRSADMPAATESQTAALPGEPLRL